MLHRLRFPLLHSPPPASSIDCATALIILFGLVGMFLDILQIHVLKKEKWKERIGSLTPDLCKNRCDTFLNDQHVYPQSLPAPHNELLTWLIGIYVWVWMYGGRIHICSHAYGIMLYVCMCVCVCVRK